MPDGGSPPGLTVFAVVGAKPGGSGASDNLDGGAEAEWMARAESAAMPRINVAMSHLPFGFGLVEAGFRVRTSAFGFRVSGGTADFCGFGMAKASAKN
jgi:hypothetical protein